MRPRSPSPTAFLLSLGALPIAGCGGDDGSMGSTGETGGPESSTSESSTSDASTGDASTGEASTSDASTSEPGSTSVDSTGEAETTAGESTTTGAGTTGTDTGSSTDASTSTDTGAVVDVCETFGDHMAMCVMGDADYYAGVCTNYTTSPNYTDDCQAAYEDLFACLGLADCDAIVQGIDVACPAEVEAVAGGCG